MKDRINTLIALLSQKQSATLAQKAQALAALFDLEGRAHMSQSLLESSAAALSERDIPTLKRARMAIDAGDLAWLGAKFVYDKALACINNPLDKGSYKLGSADGQFLLFFYTDAREFLAPRAVSERDMFQIKDITRGPHMHPEQFRGLWWVSTPLHTQQQLIVLGACDVACALARYASEVGFSVSVVDEDTAFLNELRFPRVNKILLDGGFKNIDALHVPDGAYIAVLTRGHTFDVEACAWALKQHACYIGMMGCAHKNADVYQQLANMGVTPDQWASIKRPIGLKFGAKTAEELAVSIVAELIDMRYKSRYSHDEQLEHDKSLYGA